MLELTVEHSIKPKEGSRFATNQFNLLLVVCATLAMMVSRFIHNEVDARLAFVFALASMIVGLFRWKMNSAQLPDGNR